MKTPSVSKACGAKREDHPEGLRESLEVRTSKLTTEDGRVICERCALAVRPWSRMVGLLGRASLDRGEGMLFRPTASIHMMFMRFAIDVVFCDRDLVVLSVRQGLKPWRFASHRGAKVAIELAEGAAEGLAPGTRLLLATIEP